MASSSGEPRFQKHLRDTYDDPTKEFVLYKGTRSLNQTKAPLQASFKSLGDGDVEFELKNARQELRQLTHLLNMATLDETHQVEVVVQGVTFKFSRSLLQDSSSNLACIGEVLDQSSSQDVSSSDLTTREEIQKDINKFVKTHTQYALKVVRLFERFTKYGIYGSKSFARKFGYFDFDFQIACLSFARVVSDEQFELLAAEKIKYAWAESVPQDMPTLNLYQIGLAFSMAPTLDSFLVRFYDGSMSDLEGRHRLYTKSETAHKESWRELKKRRQLHRKEKVEHAEKNEKNIKEDVEPITP